MTFDTVTVDLDGTLLPDSTLFSEVLSQHGRAEDIAASDARYFAGESSLRACFDEQWDWYQALTPGDVHRALRKANWLPDIREGVALLHSEGLRVRLLTDQPSTGTDYAARWGLEPAICSPVAVKEGEQISIEFREDKLANLLGSGLEASTVCHIGNGSNDVPIWQAGATGIAVFANPEVAAQATLDLGRPASFLDAARAAVTLRN